MCQCSGKMVDHILIHCDVVYDLLSLVFRPSRIQLGVTKEGG